VDSFSAAAADAAQARAVECRNRVTQLALHQQVRAEDVHLARAALARAQDRAEAARRRLAAARLRRLGSSPWVVAAALAHTDAASLDLAPLRAATRELSERGLYVTYFALGGNCEPLELDAFAHGALELPTEELAVLAHAVWELGEL
jgi:hypothetical protein